MSEAYVFLADGFEEIEALTAVDLLRRAGVDVRTVSIGEGRVLTGRSAISVEADEMFDGEALKDAELLVLPGGMPGTKYLCAHEGLKKLLLSFHEQGKLIGAICAAPTVLGAHGILEGAEAVCYPGMEAQLTGARVLTDREVVRSGSIITSRGAGTAIPFALELIRALKGDAAAESVAEGIVYRA